MRRRGVSDARLCDFFDDDCGGPFDTVLLLMNGMGVCGRLGKISSNGYYTTNTEGQIVISGITGTVIVTELETVGLAQMCPSAEHRLLSLLV